MLEDLENLYIGNRLKNNVPSQIGQSTINCFFADEWKGSGAKTRIEKKNKNFKVTPLEGILYVCQHVRLCIYLQEGKRRKKENLQAIQGFVAKEK